MSSIIWLLFWYSDILLGLFREGPTLRPLGWVVAAPPAELGAAGIGGAQRWGGGGEALACFQGMRRRGVRWSARTVVLRWAQERCSMECPHGCAGAGCKRGVQGNAREAVVVFLGGRR